MCYVVPSSPIHTTFSIMLWTISLLLLWVKTTLFLLFQMLYTVSTKAILSTLAFHPFLDTSRKSHCSSSAQGRGWWFLSSQRRICLQVFAFSLQSKNRWEILSSALWHKLQVLSFIILNLINLSLVASFPWQSYQAMSFTRGLAAFL